MHRQFAFLFVNRQCAYKSVFLIRVTLTSVYKQLRGECQYLPL